MDWTVAIEKNQQALKGILAVLVTMLARSEDQRAASGKITLPRHLHRYMLRLLRPAEAAVRRLIIVAAHGLVVEVLPQRPRKPKPQSTFVRDGVGTGIVRIGSLREMALARSRPVGLSLPLFDPLKRFGSR